jgi:dihydrolipoamide dehydrogenase
MAKFDYDLICIGTGAAGSVTAHIAAASGWKVAIVEAEKFGGECPNWGDVPTKALLHSARIYDEAKEAGRFGIRSNTIGYNYPSIRAWKDTAVKRTGTERGKQAFESEGINVIRGQAQFISPNEITVGRRHYSAANFLIATGSTDRRPAIEGLDKVTCLTSREAINLLRPPKSLFIIGGGPTGCEFAQLFSVFGSKVTIADLGPRLLPSEDRELGRTLADSFMKSRRAQVLTGTKIVKIEQDTLMKRVYFQQGTTVRSVKVHEVMLATGKTPSVDLGLENAGVTYSPQGIAVDEFMQTNVKHIFAAGDVTGLGNSTHVAIYQSRVAAHNLLHKQKVSASYRAVPRVVFTDPEVAAVGLTEDEAIKYALHYKTAVAPVSIVGRANISDTHDGLVKVITDHDGRLVGAAIAAPCAGEMIHELALAISTGLHAKDIANVIHAFPTWSEAVRIACSKIKA